MYYNFIWFITKVLNIIRKLQNDFYHGKEIKQSYQLQVLRISCKYSLQSSACT